ncbi:replication protein P [Neptunicella sp.]|uniref:replication protein P n=1 Tax=Neptunicella sp. TaxID=2125986 RepID=UPI003F68DD2C
MTRVQTALEGSLKPIFTVYFPDFVNKFPDDEMQDWVMREYAQQLVDLRISSDQLKLGIRKCKTLKFRPNPYQFAQLCKPSAEDLNLPSVDDAFVEVIRRYGVSKGDDNFVFSHRVVALTAERVGFKVYRMPEHDARELFDLEYSYWVTRACEDTLPEVRKAITYVPPEVIPINVYMSDGHIPKVPEAFNQRLAELGSKLKRGGIK